MTNLAAHIDWIALDWGTSHLRAWSICPLGKSTFIGQSDKGMGALRQDEFEPALLDLIGPVLDENPVDILACGMLGSRQGWTEAPYVAAPCAVPLQGLVRAKTHDARLNLFIVPGIKQNDPADVMRGEETQIAGFLAQNPGWDGIICLPGTHTKWVQISANEVVSFKTFMTGELFSLISKKSVLRHSLEQGWDEPAFKEAVSDCLSKPQQFASRLFGLRAEDLLHGQSSDLARARLSGYLIGIELAAARPYYLGQRVAILGSQTMVDVYSEALSLTGADTVKVNAEPMTLLGLQAIREGFKKAA